MQALKKSVMAERENMYREAMLEHARADLPEAAPFAVACEVGENGKLHSKLESTPHGGVKWEYGFDPAGHLRTVQRNGLLEEKYTYNERGQRLENTLAYLRPLRGFLFSAKEAMA